METEHAIKETTNCDSIGGKVKDKKKKTEEASGLASIPAS